MIKRKTIAITLRRLLVLIVAGIGLFAGVSAATAADIDILVIGSSRSFSSDQYSGVPRNQNAFNPQLVVNELTSLLNGDAGFGTVNVAFEDVYGSFSVSLMPDNVTPYSYNAKRYSLLNYYYHPDNQTNRWNNLKGSGGTNWDYVVIMGDPSIIANTPGVYARGVKLIVDKIREGGPQPILMMQWPHSGSTVPVDDFGEVTYRVGDSGGIPVAPAGYTWDAYSSKDSGAHPTPDGAYLAAATLYTKMLGKNATNSTHTSATNLADLAYNTVQTHISQSHYSGAYTNENPYLILNEKERVIRSGQNGSSTEQTFLSWGAYNANRYFNSLLSPELYINQYADDIAGYTAPTHFHLGRHNGGSKSYKPDPAAAGYRSSMGFPYQVLSAGTWRTSGSGDEGSDMRYGLDTIEGWPYGDQTVAFHMINQGEVAKGVRNLPNYSLWAAANLEMGLTEPLFDGKHYNPDVNEIIISYMMTLLTGRCPIGKNGTPTERVRQRIGYEAAWIMSTLTLRPPGFMVQPSSANAKTVTPEAGDLMTVYFVNPPLSNVTVTVATDDKLIGKVTPSVLTFTPSNYSNEQTVTVIGETGPAGTNAFTVSLTTSSGDVCFDGLQDSWTYHNIRPEGPMPSDVRITWNGARLTSGDMTPDTSDGTEFGATIGSAAHTFAITNTSGSTMHDLTDSPRVTLSGDASFSLSQDALTNSLAPGASTTFEITYNPSVAGVHTGLLAVASTDTLLPVQSFAISGLRPSAPSVTNGDAVAVDESSATLSGRLVEGVSADAWICWGERDAGTTSTALWENVTAVGTVTDGISFSGLVSGLATNSTYWYRCYVSSGAGHGWSSAPTSFHGKPVAEGVQEVVVGVSFRSSDGATEMLSTDSAGAVEVHANWNNSDGSTDGTTTNISSPASAKLSDSSGAETDLAIAWDFDTTWKSGNSGTSDERLMDGYLDNTAGDSTIAVSNIGVASFDVYVYVGSGGDNRTGTIGVDGSDTYSFNTHSASAKSFPSDYLQTTDKGTSYPDANYAVWSDLTGAGFTIRHTRGSDNSGIHGMQVVLKLGPPIANLAPTGISEDAAALNASLNASDTNYTVDVFWGTTDGGTNAGSWDFSTTVGSWANVSTNVSYTASLLSGETYFYTFRASNAGTNCWAAASWTFTMAGTPNPNLPAIISTDGAAGITDTNAYLHGWLTSTGGADTTVTCYWNADTDPGMTTVGWDHSRSFGVAAGIGKYTNNTAVTATLLPATTYYYRYRAANSFGTNWSSSVGFTTFSDPVIDNASGATSLSETSASLRGELTAGLSASAWICWGDDDAGTVSTSLWDNVVAIGVVSQGATFSNTVAGLATNTTYFYRCYAVNGVGQDWSGSAQAFSGTPVSAGTGDSGGISTNEFQEGVSPSVGYTAPNTYIRSNQATTVLDDDPDYETILGYAGGEMRSLFAFDLSEIETAASGSPITISGVVLTVTSRGSNQGSTPINLDLHLYESAFDETTATWNDPDGVGGADPTAGGTLGTKLQSHTVAQPSAVAPGETIAFTNSTEFATAVTDALGAADNTLRMILKGDSTSGGNNFVRLYDEAYASMSYRPKLTVIFSTGDAIVIANRAAADITDSAAMLTASVDAAGTNYVVYVYYGTTDGGTNASAWAATNAVGSFTNVSTNVSYSPSSLTAGQPYHYTFMASNSSGVVWASPSWKFTTLGTQAVTTNHAVPHVWLAGINPAWTNDYEAAATNDHDNDGFSTWEEYWSGTNPTNGNSFLKIDAVLYDGSNVIIEWQHDSVDAAIPPIAIEVSADLTGTWVNVDHQMPSNGLNSWLEASFQKRFYRLAVTNAP